MSYRLLSDIVREYAIAQKTGDGTKAFFLKQLVDSRKYVDDINGPKAHPLTTQKAVKERIAEENKVKEVATVIPKTETNPVAAETKMENSTVDLSPNQDLFKPSI